jgi:hypothetical protein
VHEGYISSAQRTRLKLRGSSAARSASASSRCWAAACRWQVNRVSWIGAGPAALVGKHDVGGAPICESNVDQDAEVPAADPTFATAMSRSHFGRVPRSIVGVDCRKVGRPAPNRSQGARQPCGEARKVSWRKVKTVLAEAKRYAAALVKVEVVCASGHLGSEPVDDRGDNEGLVGAAPECDYGRDHCNREVATSARAQGVIRGERQAISGPPNLYLTRGPAAT